MFIKRVITTLAAVVAVALLLAGGYRWGFQEGTERPQTIRVEGVANIEGGQATDFDTFWQAWDAIEDVHLKGEELDNQARVYGAISGLVGALEDPYSEFFPPEDNQSFQEDIQGRFGGIGAEIGIRRDRLVIVAPLKDSPSMRAGLKAGDHIMFVNSSSTDNLSLREAVQLIRGLEGSEVTLTVFRDTWERPRDIAIIREEIVVPTLEAEFLEDNILHIELFSFNANADTLFHRAILTGLFGGAEGMVLDLRNNPGGFLQVAINLAGWFFPPGTLVVSEETREGITQRFHTQGNASLVEFPVVVLINEGSASAAEILAGALRDHRDVPIVGETSFGKGTIQELRDLSDGSSLKLTTAHWVLPSGHVIEGAGLVPDYEVEFTEEDIENERDPQLEKALEVLREELEATER